MNTAEAFELLVAIVKGAEGLSLRAYPDPASPLYKAMAKAGVIRSYMAGQGEVPESMRGLSGAPWTIGHGETAGVKENDRWTAEYADLRVRHRLAEFLAAVYAKCPVLHLLEPERAVACASLAYNIGIGAFSASSVSRYTLRQQFALAAKSFLLWNKAGGIVLAGLTARRKMESLIYQLLYGKS